MANRVLSEMVDTAMLRMAGLRASYAASAEAEGEALAAVQPPRTATAVLERPTGSPWQLPPSMPPNEYLEKCKAIRLNTPQIVEARLDRFLVDHGWLVYDYDKVMAYLKQLAERANPHVTNGGTSLVGSPGDYASYVEYEVARIIMMMNFNGPPRVKVCWAPLRHEDGGALAEVYTHPVPAHALDKVYALEQEFGPKVLTFCVSDYEAEDPDPFLLVRAHGNDCGRVIDVWDEPGWGV